MTDTKPTAGRQVHAATHLQIVVAEPAPEADTAPGDPHSLWSPSQHLQAPCHAQHGSTCKTMQLSVSHVARQLSLQDNMGCHATSQQCLNLLQKGSPVSARRMPVCSSGTLGSMTPGVSIKKAVGRSPTLHQHSTITTPGKALLLEPSFALHLCLCFL